MTRSGQVAGRRAQVEADAHHRIAAGIGGSLRIQHSMTTAAMSAISKRRRCSEVMRGELTASSVAVERHLPLVYAAARRLMPRLPAWVEVDDVIQDGARRAAGRHRPLRRGAGRHVQHVRGAAHPWGHARRAAGCGRAGSSGGATAGRERTGGGILGARKRRPSSSTWKTSPAWRLRSRGRARGPRPPRSSERVRGLVALLPRREREVIEGLYWQEQTREQVGAGLGRGRAPRPAVLRAHDVQGARRRGGVSANRVAQLRAQALERLRAALA